MAYPGVFVVIAAFILGVVFAIGVNDEFNSSQTSGFVAGISLCLGIVLAIVAAIYLHA